jgi:putative spermidine/putrescine transport system permease protein
MALPLYKTPFQRFGHYLYLGFSAFVLFFLVAPLVAVIPLSFTSSAFLNFTPEMLALDPEAFSLRWYKIMIGDCSDPTITTVCSDKWKDGAANSLIIAVFATLFSVVLGTLASLGLTRPAMPYQKIVTALLISPMIVPLIITASGMFMFFSSWGLVGTFMGLILAHTILGIPFVVITVTATLVGFDHSLMRAAASLGGAPTRNFFQVMMPLILPGVISGGLFAFITSFDEVVVMLFIGGPEVVTLPKQMWAGIRQEISPTILSVATVLVIFSVILLTTVEMLRRRTERIRGITPH